MPSRRKYVKSFSEFEGINLRTSDLVTPRQFATDGKNFSLTKSRSLEKRKGLQYKLGNFGGAGLARFDDTGVDGGSTTPRLVCVDDSMYVMTDNSFTITYSGSNISLLDIKPENGNMFLNITEDQTSILSTNLGKGLDEASTFIVNTLISQITALTDYTCTLSSGSIGTGSAAYIDLVEGHQLSATEYVVNYKMWSLVSGTDANPLTSFFSNRNNGNFENATFTQMQNVLYVSSGYNDLLKYDGNRIYRAGMPAGGDVDGSGDSGSAPTIADSVGGSTFSVGTYYNYFFLYKQIDNKGNITEGIPSPYSLEIQGNNKDFDVTIPTLKSGGFNESYAIVNGGQVGVTTLTVDDGSGGNHNMTVGDKAYFYDDATSAYVTKEITAITGTTISFVGSVNVTDNYVISNNLILSIYRTKDKGASTSDENARTYFLVDEIPNDPSNNNQIFTDTITDSNLIAEYISPLKPHGLPPRGRYCTKFQNQMIIAGNINDLNNWYYSDIDSPEYFPAGSNQALVDAFPGAKITGIGALDTALIIFKDRSIVTISGQLSDDTFKQDEVSSGDIGCVAHNTIKRVNNSLFFLSRKGIYSLNSEIGAEHIGFPVSTEFTDFDSQFNLFKANAEHWQDEDKYVLFVPAEGVDSLNQPYANSDSKVFVYDYFFGSWFIWDSINSQGGLVDIGGQLWGSSRRLDSDSNVTEYQSFKFSKYGNRLDYADHVNSIPLVYKSHWESLGAPELLKRALRLKSYSLPNDISNSQAPLFALTCEFEFDYISPGTIFSFTQDFSGGSSGYGNGQWGSIPWGDSALSEIKSKLKSSKCRSIRAVFSNDVLHENILISGYEVEFITPFRPRMK